MAQALDVTVVVPPPLRALFEGRREVTLGVPGETTVAEVWETLLKLYPRLRQHFAGDQPVTGGFYVQLALDEHSLAELASGGTGLSTGGRLYLFCLSRPSPGGRPGA
ncbi:MAG: MoaD/ThiS family protein [Archangium sp.]